MSSAGDEAPGRSHGKPAMGTVIILVAALLSLIAGSINAPVAAVSRGRPGDLVSATPITAYLAPGVPMPGEAWKIEYLTGSPTGGLTRVSGTVLVPGRSYPNGRRPLLGYAPGTTGMADRCAISRHLAHGTSYEGASIYDALRRGWAVAVTDYPGLGTPGDHTYVVGQALGRSVLDAMRAARKLDATSLSAQGPAAIYGYSEGGSGAGWAAELQPTYAPDLPLRGVVAGGVPANPSRLFASADGTPWAFLLLYTAVGFDQAYPTLDLDAYLNNRGRHAVDILRDSCLPDALLRFQLWPHRMTAYMVSDPLRSSAWQRRLRGNSLGRHAPMAPVLLGAGLVDPVIPYRQVRRLYDLWCARGASARFVSLPGEHVTGGAMFFPRAFDFLQDRFAGRALAPTEDCR